MKIKSKLQYLTATSYIIFSSMLLAPRTILAANGVLVKGTVPNNFEDYITAFYAATMPIIITIAVLMIIYSGVQYIAGGVSPESGKAAKERITNIIIGLIFYTMLRYIAILVIGDPGATTGVSGGAH